MKLRNFYTFLLLLSIHLLHAQVEEAIEETPKQYKYITHEQKNGKWGIVARLDNQPVTLIPQEYDYISKYWYDWTVAGKNNRYGFINTQNKIVLPFDYDSVHDYCHLGYAAFKKGNKWGVINHKGVIILPFEYNDISLPVGFDQKPNTYAYGAEWLSKGIGQKINFVVQKGGLYGIVNSENMVILPVEHQEIQSLQGDCSLILKKNNKYAKYICYFPDRAKFRYDAMEQNRSQMFMVAENGKKGMVDSEDKVVISLEYKELVYISRNYYGFKKEQKYGIIALNHSDNAMRILIPETYDSIFLKAHEHAELIKNGQSGLFSTKTGQVILPVQFDAITVPPSGEYIVRQGANWGLYSAKGRLQVPPKYQSITTIPQSMVSFLYLVQKNNKMGMIDSTGRELAECKYDSIQYQQFFTNAQKQANGCKNAACYSAIFTAALNNKIYLLNSEGQLYNQKGIDHFKISNNWIITTEQQKNGIIWISGETIALPQYEEVIVGPRPTDGINDWIKAGKMTQEEYPAVLAWIIKGKKADLFDKEGKKITTIE